MFIRTKITNCTILETLGSLQISQMSGVLFAKFDPSNSNLALVIQALDNHQVRVQAVVLAQDSLNALLQLRKGQKVSALEWVSKEYVAVGLTSGAILIYSPAANKIVRELASPSNMAVMDIHFSKITNSAWVIDANGTLCEWDIYSYALSQHFHLPEVLDTTEKIYKLSTVLYKDNPMVLIGAHGVYLVDLVSRSVEAQFPGHVQPIIAIVPSEEDLDLFLTAAEDERFINVCSISQKATKAVLVASSTVRQMTLAGNAELAVAAVITEKGQLEVFKDPLNFKEQPLELSKKRRKQSGGTRSKHSDGMIQYARPGNEIRNPDNENIFLFAAVATESLIHVGWLENDLLCRFDTLLWNRNGDFALVGNQKVTKSKQIMKPTAHNKDGHDLAAPRLYSEYHTVITEGGVFQDEIENLDDDDDSLAEKLEKITGQKSHINGRSKKLLKKHTAGSLTVVLSQALRNNDNALLETVLVNRDPSIVQSTISRLDSSLTVLLLDRLAEKITRQQLRFDQMNFWLKWIIIIHGGVLSSLPNVRHKLANLHAVLEKKALKLPRLLELQGRLSMLERLSSLRREILKGAQTLGEQNEQNVEYIEEVDDAVHAGVLEDDNMEIEDNQVEDNSEEEEEDDYDDDEEKDDYRNE